MSNTIQETPNNIVEINGKTWEMGPIAYHNCIALAKEAMQKSGKYGIFAVSKLDKKKKMKHTFMKNEHFNDKAALDKAVDGYTSQGFSVYMISDGRAH